MESYNPIHLHANPNSKMTDIHEPLTPALSHSRNLGRLDSRVDLLIGSLVEWQQRASDSGVVQDASGDESVLEGDRALHVRASVVHRSGDGQQPVVHLSCLLVVLCLSGVEQLKQRFRGDTAVANEHAVDVEGGVEEVLVVAGEGVDVGTLAPDDGDLTVPSSHVSDAVLHGEDAWLGEDVELSLQVVRRLGGIGVLEEDERETRSLVDRLVSSLGCALLVAESKPAVAGISSALD